MRTGEVANQAGVNIQTLLYYERRGLLPRAERCASGYRDFDGQTVPLVRFIKHAQQLGFTLREIEELIELRDSPARNAAAVCAVASAKVNDIAMRIRHLSAIQRVLEDLISECKSGRGERPCPIIEALDQESVTACCEAANA